MISEWTCTGDGTTTDCVVVATTTDMSVPTFQDWVFAQMWIVFLLALIAIGYFFSGFKKGDSVR